MKFLLMGLALWLASFAPAVAACTGLNSRSGQAQSVREIYRTGYSHPGRFIAEATHDPRSGRPLIIYYRRYRSLPGYYRSFVRHHECCHHLLDRRGARSSDEVAANCCALRRMGLSRGGLARIKNYMIKHDINSDVIFNYHGAGVSFWNRTASRCLGGRR